MISAAPSITITSSCRYHPSRSVKPEIRSLKKSIILIIPLIALSRRLGFRRSRCRTSHRRISDCGRKSRYVPSSITASLNASINAPSSSAHRYSSSTGFPILLAPSFMSASWITSGVLGAGASTLSPQGVNLPLELHQPGTRRIACPSQGRRSQKRRWPPHAL